MNGPVAYTYEADHHCPACALARFGADENGYVPKGAIDGEGNEPGALAPWDEWYDIGEGHQTLACADCGAVLDTYEDEEDQ